MLKHILTLLPIPVQLWIALGMYKRKQHLKYPVFWSYLWFQVAILPCLIILARSSESRGFFLVYWGDEFVTTVFTLAVMREVFVKLLADYSILTRFQRHGYEVGLAFACLVAVLISTRVPGRAFLVRNTIQIQHAVSSVAVIMLLFVAAAALALGIRWRSELCGIAAGLGLQGVTDAVIFTDILRRGGYTAETIGWIEIIAYNFSFLIFALYFLVPQEQAQAPPLRKEMEWLQSMSETVPK
jgi:uncharacterized membrane protein